MKVKCRHCTKLVDKESAIRHPDKQRIYFCCQECLQHKSNQTQDIEVTCRYCKNKINKSEAFKDPESKTSYYCNKEHQQKHKEPKKKPKAVTKTKVNKPIEDKSDYRILTDYIQDLYGKENCNWPMLTAQIDRMVKSQKFKYQGILLTLQYCYDKLEFKLDVQYGIEKVVISFYEVAKDEWKVNKELNILGENFEEDSIKIMKASPRVKQPHNTIDRPM